VPRLYLAFVFVAFMVAQFESRVKYGKRIFLEKMQQKKKRIAKIIAQISLLFLW
jgi:hypothetical protein